MITLPDHKRRLKLRDVSERRGPASVAQLLYDDLTPPKPPEPPTPADLLLDVRTLLANPASTADRDDVVVAG